MPFGVPSKSILLVSAMLLLAACDTAEERAEEHFESALALVEAGDGDRAIVEFRNVFQLNPEHVKAREAFGALMLERGNTSAAYTNFLRVVELQPDNLPSRLQLSQMAILSQNWDEARRHGAVVVQAQLETTESEIVDLALRYQTAAADDDVAELQRLTREVEALYERAPENEIVMRLLIESYSREDRMQDALRVVDNFLELKPLDPRMNLLKLQIATRREDNAAAEEQLRLMVERFPDNERVKESLLRLLVATAQPDAAESFVRDLITQAEGTDLYPDRVVTLVQYLRQRDGDDAAIAELDAAVAATEDNAIFKALKASIIFDSGARDDGISLLQNAIDGAEESDQTNQLKVSLARMLQATGNETGARALIDEVLTADNSNGDAVKLQAAWFIQDDRADEAIAMLRLVLDQAPDDSAAMLLMADAHARNGNTELSRDLLSLAVEASENGRTESLRFASALLRDGSLRPAEDVLIQALRQTPNDFALLENLAQVYLRMEDFPRATGVEEALRRLDTPQANQSADNLRVAIIARREGRDEATAFLEQLATGNDATLAAQVNLLRARLSNGDSAGALALAEELLATQPDNPALQLVVANTNLALQNFETAERMIRDIAVSDVGNDRLWLQLIRVVGAQGRREDVDALTDEGLQRFPGSPRIRWAQASRMESLGDIEGAIGVYEDLYSENSDNLIVANNLASLLSTYRGDEESLDRAWAVARRLRGTEVAPFQDTYGWITFRRGNVTEALEYLAPAAESLSTNPIVQFHYASALEAAERPVDALEAYRRAVELADETDTRQQIEDARTAITRLEAAGTE